MQSSLPIPDYLPVLAVCGWSNSGKTTLIEHVIPKFVSRGLKVAVVKHDAHGINIDRPGKDSDRFFQAGAEVYLQGPDQNVCRNRRDDNNQLFRILRELARRNDLILVEGHKATPLPKVWLHRKEETYLPTQVQNVKAMLPFDANRPAKFHSLLQNFLRIKVQQTPIMGCILIGGKSSRMGTPKHLIRQNGRTWLEHTVATLEPFVSDIVIAGDGAVPNSLHNHTRLPDVPDARGPMAGILATMRWSPDTSWLVAACDMPFLSPQAVHWLLDCRRPGVWANMPRLTNAPGVEPLLAYYDFRSHELLEELAAWNNFKLANILAHPQVISLKVPSSIAIAWKNVNSPLDLTSPIFSENQLRCPVFAP